MKTIHLNPISILPILMFTNLFVNAQQYDVIEKVNDNISNKVIFARFSDNENIERKITNALPFLKSFLNVKTGTDYQLTETQKDEYGFIHQKYQQYYKGIKIVGGEYVIHAKEYIQTVNGIFADIEMDVNPLIDSIAAISYVANYIIFKNFKWNINTKQDVPLASLVIVRDSIDLNWNLAWMFTVVARDMPQAENIYINAKTGQLLKRTPLICNTNTPGTADTRYSGNQAITGDSFTGGFRLREVQNGVNIQTFNFLHSTDITNTSGAVDFVDNNNTWTAVEWNNANKDNMALDIHWAAERIYSYWRTVHNRNSIDNNGLTIKNYVHLGTNLNNAYWYPGNYSMFYGDGDNTIFRPFAALDICAHEFGHGINQFTANLTGGTQESGALNEGFSDIWGACIEQWTAQQNKHGYWVRK